MILTRLGNKRALKDKLHAHFPPHRMRIELFFGAGGSFFYLPTPKFSILNDFDDDVTNLFLVIQNNKEALKRNIEYMPISESLIRHWRKNPETEPLKKAIRFLLLSNFTYLGKGDTIRLGIDHTKRNIIERIEPTFEKLKNAKIITTDFRNVLGEISFTDSVTPKNDCFVFLDPVYHGTVNNYRVPMWNINDTEDCFKLMATCGIKCGMTEFNSPSILGFAERYGMNVIYIDERRNLKNRQQEILITNFTNPQTQFNF